MSQHFEIVFSVFLRDDTPADVLAELQWHLGLSTEQPEHLAIDYGEPLLRPSAPSYLPGGESVKLERQHRYTSPSGEHYAWGLYARLFWLDDQWADVWWQVAEWLAPWVEDEGYAGSYREEYEDTPVILLIRNGEAHLREFKREEH